MTTEPKVVLDASAVLAWVLNERGSATVARMLPVGVVPVSALIETLYRAAEKGHRQTVDELHASVVAMGAHIEPLTEADADRAATLIAESRKAATRERPASLSLGDGMCIATAERLDLTVTGGDQHWATCDLSVAFLPFR